MVDRNALKTNQAAIVVLVAIAFIFWLPWLVAVVAISLGLGLVAPGAGPFRLFYTRVLRPAGIARPDVVREDPAPHRLAQGVGTTFLSLSVILLAAGVTTVGWALALPGRRPRRREPVLRLLRWLLRALPAKPPRPARRPKGRRGVTERLLIAATVAVFCVVAYMLVQAYLALRRRAVLAAPASEAGPVVGGNATVLAFSTAECGRCGDQAREIAALEVAPRRAGPGVEGRRAGGDRPRRAIRRDDRPDDGRPRRGESAPAPSTTASRPEAKLEAQVRAVLSGEPLAA